MCVCVCVSEREREREKRSDTEYVWAIEFLLVLFKSLNSILEIYFQFT